MNRLWLDVPYSEKDAAKAAGARWDPHARRWYAPDRRRSLWGWAPKPALPVVLPGEDRTFGAGLFVDPVPESCWFTNVRSCIADGDWDRVRRMVYGRAEQRCEACGAPADRDHGVTLQAHERWEYDAGQSIQRLKRLVCLCSRCHEATHFGYAQITGNDERAMRHLALVNDWTRGQVLQHIDATVESWAWRSRRTWSLDLSILADAGVEIAAPPEATERRGIAERALR